MRAAGLLALALTAPAHAYELDTAFTAPVHEAITMLAADCAHEAGDADPGDVSCESALTDLRARWRQERRRLRRDVGQRTSDIARQVRWPDNPERKHVIGLGLTIVRCPGRMARGKTSLTCESHHGGLQFFPAMASSADEPPEQTREKLLGWLGFLFDVNANAIAPSESVCDAARRTSSQPDFVDAIEASLPCDLTVGALFDHTDVRLVARGALLHAIQDSYSMSHARRSGERPDDFTAISRCEPIREFYEYGSGYQQHHHGRADVFPELAPCDGPVVDVVTASAVAMLLLDDDRDDFLAYVEERILGR